LSGDRFRNRQSRHNYFAKCAIDEEELIPVNQAEKSLGTCTDRLSGCNPLQPKNKLEEK
jgi:hypothetical protein